MVTTINSAKKSQPNATSLNFLPAFVLLWLISTNNVESNDFINNQ